jgi:hypothetical protein
VASDGLQTQAPEAQEIERRIRSIWRMYEEGTLGKWTAARLVASLDDLTWKLGSLDVDYDEWQMIYRQVLQLDRALRGEAQLLDDPMTYWLNEARASQRGRQTTA